MRQRAETSWLRYTLQQLEQPKMRRTKGAILDRIDALFVRSERDRRKIARARGIVEIAPVGLNSPDVGWLGDGTHVAAFGGAMWRPENALSATFLAQEVWPLVRKAVPDAELRIFGARPTSAVRLLGGAPGVTVVGEVADYDAEFRHAAVTLAPAMVDAGLLMKAIRAMAMGCPVVLNSASAGPIVGLEDGVHASVGDNPVALASHITELMQNRKRAAEIGAAARYLVRPHFSWDRTVAVYCKVFEQMLQR